MDPALLSDAVSLLRAHGLRPRKSWGQNFLCDRNVIERIVRAAALHPEDRTLEIGGGMGALTRSLAVSASQVTSVEIDRLLEPILQGTVAHLANVSLVFDDFLKLNMSDLLDTAFGDGDGVVVASIPYYISTPILERLFEHKSRIRRIVLVVQEEFGRRLAGKPGTEDYGSLSVFAQYHADVEMVGKVSRHVFLPQPEVGSAIVKLEMHTEGCLDAADEAALFRVVRSAFGKRRKTLLNALSSKEMGLTRDEAAALLDRASIDPNRRGETLSLDEFARIARAYT